MALEIALCNTDIPICHWFFIQYNLLAKSAAASKITHLPAYSFIR